MSSNTTKRKDEARYIEISGQKIEKLKNAENYLTWRSRISLAFKMLEIYGYLDGSIKCPEEPRKPAGMPDFPQTNGDNSGPDQWEHQRAVYTAELEKYIDLKEKFDKGLPKVLFNLKGALSDTIASRVEDMDEPSAIWTFLKNQYRNLGAAQLMSNRIAVWNLTYDESYPISEFFDRIEEAAKVFKGLPKWEISMEDLLTITVKGMPNSYAATISSLYAQTSGIRDGATREMLDTYQQALKDEYINKKNQPSTASSYVALTKQYADPPDHQPEPYFGRWYGEPCRQCKKMHPTYSCFEKYPWLKTAHLQRKAQQLAKNGGQSTSNNNNSGGSSTGSFKPRFNPANNGGKSSNNGNGKRPLDVIYMVNMDPSSFNTGNAMDKFRSKDGRLAPLLDSGTTEHAFCDIREFSELDLFPQPKQITVGGGYQLEVHGIGKATLLVDANGLAQRMTITQVYFVPKLGANLLSQQAFARKGLDVTFTAGGRGYVYDQTGRVVLTTSTKFKQNVVDFATDIEDACKQTTKDTHDALLTALITYRDVPYRTSVPMATLLHQRLGHPSLVKMKKMGIKIDSFGICEPCIKAKSLRKRITTPQERESETNAKIHTDTCGPIDPPAIFTNAQYFNLFIDDKTRYQTFAAFPTRDKVFEVTKKFLDILEKEQFKVFTLRSDHGGEYTSGAMDTLLSNKLIKLELSAVGTPEQNGVAERSFRTLVALIKCHLFTSGLPACFWQEAASYANKQINRMVRKSLGNISPYELYTGESPNTSHFRVFGCNAYSLIKTEQPKLASNTRTCVFLDVVGENQYRLYDHERNMIFTARDVEFDEGNFSLAKQVFKDYENITDDDPADGDYDPDAYYNIFSFLSASSDSPIITKEGALADLEGIIPHSNAEYQRTPILGHQWTKANFAQIQRSKRSSPSTRVKPNHSSPLPMVCIPNLPVTTTNG